MTASRERLATRLDAELLAGLRAVAKAEGRQLEALMDEAVSDLLEKRRQGGARPHVMAAYGRSHGRYGRLYEKLAK